MRENRTHGSEGGESGSTGLPYPYQPTARTRQVVEELKGSLVTIRGRAGPVNLPIFGLDLLA